MYDHGFKEMTPKSRSPYQLFAMEYAKKIYDYIIDRYRLHTADEKKPNNYVKLVSIVWNEAVLKPVLSAIYGADTVLDAILNNQKALSKLKTRKELKELIISIVTNYFTCSDQINSGLLYFIRDTTIGLIND